MGALENSAPITPPMETALETIFPLPYPDCSRHSPPRFFTGYSFLVEHGIIHPCGTTENTNCPDAYRCFNGHHFG